MNRRVCPDCNNKIKYKRFKKHEWKARCACHPFFCGAMSRAELEYLIHQLIKYKKGED